MANQAAKKRLQQNQWEIKKLVAIVGVAHVVVCLWLWWNWSTISWKTLTAHATNSGSMISAFWLLRTIASPTYSPSGELTDGGADLGLKGALHQYYFDVVYVTAFVAVLSSLVSPWFWAVHAGTISFAVYKIWTGIIAPFFLSGSAGSEAQSRESGNRKQRRSQHH